MEAYRDIIDRFPALWVIEPSFPQHLRDFIVALDAGDEDKAIDVTRAYYRRVDSELHEGNRTTRLAPAPAGAKTRTIPSHARNAKVTSHDRPRCLGGEPSSQTQAADSSGVHAIRAPPGRRLGARRPFPLGTGAARALAGLIVALCPASPAPTSREIFDRVDLHVRHFMTYMPPLAARGFWLCIVLLDWAPLWLFQSAHRLSALPRARASALLSEMVDGRFAFLRTIVVAVRGLVLNAYFDQDEVQKAIGYEPIPFLEERIERRRVLLLAPVPARAGGYR